MQITHAEVVPVELSLRQAVQIAHLAPIQAVTAIFVRLETRQGRMPGDVPLPTRNSTVINRTRFKRYARIVLSKQSIFTLSTLKMPLPNFPRYAWTVPQHYAPSISLSMTC
jgi:hypothetical protein